MDQRKDYMNANETIQYMIAHNQWVDPTLISHIVESSPVDKWACPVCGEVRTLFKDKVTGAKWGRTCGATECHPGYGKLRPSHSAHMKALAASGTNQAFNATLTKRGQLHNKTVNTPEFFVKVLATLGVSSSLEDWERDLHVVLSTRGKNRVIRTKTIITKFNQWPVSTQVDAVASVGGPVTIDALNALADDEFLRVYKMLHGMQTTVNMENHVGTGRNLQFKRVLITTPKYNIDGVAEVLTRSGTEATYIELFEKLGVLWRYEPFRIPKEAGGYYKPDFFIVYNDRKIILEVKGNYYRTTKEEFVKVKGTPASNFAKERGWEYCISTVGNPRTMDFLDEALFL